MQAERISLTVRDRRRPRTRTQKLSRRLLRNDRCPCRPSRRAAVTSLFIRTPIRSQTNRKFYGPVSLLPENVVYREVAQGEECKPLLSFYFFSAGLLAKATRDAGQSRRLLALAEIYDGGSR